MFQGTNGGGRTGSYVGGGGGGAGGLNGTNSGAGVQLKGGLGVGGGPPRGGGSTNTGGMATQHQTTTSYRGAQWAGAQPHTAYTAAAAAAAAAYRYAPAAATITHNTNGAQQYTNSTPASYNTQTHTVSIS